MCPNSFATDPAPKSQALARAIAVTLGQDVRLERLRRQWRLEDLARRAGMSVAAIHSIESGEVSSIGGYARIAVAFGWDPAFSLRTPRLTATQRDADPVHAALGEIEASHFRRPDREVRLDEPYQHYQFSGRADGLVVDPMGPDLLHIENKTGFPDTQGFLGTWNAKRAYLADELAERFGLVDRRWRSVSHVVVALWSAEVLHSLRLRTETFRTACPDPETAFAAWWSGTPPPPGVTSSLVVFDPLEGLRSSRRRWITLDVAVDRSTDPRYRGYAAALESLKRARLA